MRSIEPVELAILGAELTIVDLPTARQTTAHARHQIHVDGGKHAGFGRLNIVIALQD